MMRQVEERSPANDTSNLVPVDPPADLDALERHEVSEVFGDMDDEEWDDFLKDFTANPLPELLLIILYDGKVLDGWHRLHAAIMTRNTHLLQFREYLGTRPGMIANFANTNRRNLESSRRSAAAVRNYRYDRSLSGKSGDDVAREFPTDEVAESARVSSRQMRRAFNAEQAGLGDYVLNGEITAEDGEQIAKLGLAEKVRSGEMTIGEASKIVRERRVERRKPKAQSTPATSDTVSRTSPAPSLTEDDALSSFNETMETPTVVPDTPVVVARTSTDGAAELDQVQEKYHQLRLDYEALYNDHVELREAHQEVQDKLTSVTRRWRESMSECESLRARVAELETAEGVADTDVEVGPVPESA